MLRFTWFVLLLASFFAPAAGFSQSTVPPAPAAAVTADQPVAQEVTEAEAAIAKSDWKTAEARLDSWLAAHPADARALFDAGYVADAQNRLDDAAALYRRAVAANPQSFEAHVELGMVLARQGKLAEARPELAAATQLDAGEAGPRAKAQAWRALARIDSATDPAQASADLLEALKLSPETPGDTLLAARLAEQASQPVAAEAAYRRILAKDPKSIPANAGLARILIANKEYAEAEPLLRTALAGSPGDPALTAQLATVLAAQNKAEALPLLQQLHQAHPADAAITRMLADVLAQAGDAAGSDKLYLALLAAHPKNPDLLVAHGQNLILQLKYPEAFAVFSQATQLAPANGEAWSGLAFAASKTGQPAITLRALAMRAKSLPEVASTCFLRATAYDTLHDKANAAAWYHRFLDASAGKFPNQEWQARQRLLALGEK